jgi:hypothetical protein
MLGLVLIYFLAKAFYDLAGEHDKHQTGYAVAGVVTYYLGSFIGGILIVIGMEIITPGSVDEIDDTMLGIIAVPFGLFIYWLLYRYLKRSWERGVIVDNPDILDDEML